MDVALDDISEVVSLVDEWNASYASSLQEVDNGPPSTAGGDTVAQRATSRKGGEGVSEGGSGGGGGNGKFCIGCGVRIPSSANFCPECGAKQETVGA